MHLSEKFFSVLPNNITPDTTKHFIIFRDQNEKKACFSGKRVQLLSYSSDFGENFVEVTESEAKEKHLGKMRCLGTISNEYELLILFSKYFGFTINSDYVPIFSKTKTLSRTSVKKEKKQRKRREKLEIKVDQLPQDRDEKELIIEYRNTESKVKKDKIFKIILFQRGVNGKTWSQIIKNYVAYNKHKINCFQDRTEEDFYQDLVIALHNQVEKWFDVKLDYCFSTYAWYVIKCAFSRVLQTLSTQKRKVSSVKSIELDDPEFSWSESISTNDTVTTQSSFECDFDNRNLCDHIEDMFVLKCIEAPEDLKQELLEIIRNKSTMQNSLYTLAKKYKMDVREVFILERDLRENLKNSMIHDIITHLKYDINADDQIARKYKRSKGHVIKTKRQFVTSVKTKLQGIDK